jgi:RNA polymerase sigma-70 factor (ECF subfamily)
MSAHPLRNPAVTPTVGGLADDQEAFGRLVEAHRRDLVLLGYRFLGSIGEAEEAAQEAFLRAWRGRDSFRGDASIRTWLHRIATRVCLDAIEHRRRRVLPSAIRAAADPAHPPEPASTEVLWLEPIPDDYLVDAGLDPAARYSLRESVSLAFLAALQTLPARQRAVLILRDVLDWSAAEVAPVLGMSVGAVNSALHRARSALRASHHRSGIDAMTSRSPDDPAIRRLLDAYVRAWEADDVDGILATLKDDVRLAMPPSPSWYQGRAAVGELLSRWIIGTTPSGRFRLPITSANGQPAVGFLELGPDGSSRVVGVHVLTVDPDGIAEITAFMDPAIAARFEFAR